MVLVSSRQQRYVYERTEEEDEKCRRRRKRRMNELAGRQAGKRRNVESIFFSSSFEVFIAITLHIRMLWICVFYVLFSLSYTLLLHSIPLSYAHTQRMNDRSLAHKERSSRHSEIRIFRSFEMLMLMDGVHFSLILISKD